VGGINMKRLRKKQLSKYRGKTWVTISQVGEGIWGSSFHYEDIKNLYIKRDTTYGKNLITVKINERLVYSFDSNFKGHYLMENNIQKPLNARGEF
jgi:hypothetical protein